ncbi:MAG: hypothetical protein AB1757_25490 [Acidobacteriota bacterium]
MPVYYCAGACQRLISVSTIPGGNPVAQNDPEHWATEYVNCSQCGAFYCTTCAAHKQVCCAVELLPEQKPKTPQDQIYELLNVLHRLAQKMVAEKMFQPLGASLSLQGAVTFEYLPPLENEPAFDFRKRLHRKLIEIARSGQAKAVGICHSLQTAQGAYVVISLDHAADKPITFLFAIESTAEGDTLSSKPVVQNAAYVFFKFVDAQIAWRWLQGRWLRESGQNGPEDMIYWGNGVFQTPHLTGQWGVQDGDFFTTVIEVAQAPQAYRREARIIALDANRLELQESIGGMAVQTVYRRYQ